jgi:hypothetical protein
MLPQPALVARLRRVAVEREAVRAARLESARAELAARDALLREEELARLRAAAGRLRTLAERVVAQRFVAVAALQLAAAPACLRVEAEDHESTRVALEVLAAPLAPEAEAGTEAEGAEAEAEQDPASALAARLEGLVATKAALESAVAGLDHALLLTEQLGTRAPAPRQRSLGLESGSPWQLKHHKDIPDDLLLLPAAEDND